MCNISPVCPRRGPAQSIFLCSGPGEELRGGREDGRDGRQRDRVVGEVDEAGGLETF